MTRPPLAFQRHPQSATPPARDQGPVSLMPTSHLLRAALLIPAALLAVAATASAQALDLGADARLDARADATPLLAAAQATAASAEADAHALVAGVQAHAEAEAADARATTVAATGSAEGEARASGGFAAELIGGFVDAVAGALDAVASLFVDAEADVQARADGAA